MIMMAMEHLQIRMAVTVLAPGESFVTSRQVAAVVWEDG